MAIRSAAETPPSSREEIVFADLDGIVAIPKELEKQVLDQAYDKAGKENTVRTELLNGALLGEAWRKHGALSAAIAGHRLPIRVAIKTAEDAAALHLSVRSATPAPPVTVR